MKMKPDFKPIPLLDLTEQYLRIKPEIDAAIADVVTSQRFILGPVVESFEKEVAAYLGAKHALGVASGTDALFMALMALGVGPGDEVVTTPYSFFATAEVVLLLGAKPVFADIDPVTFNLDPAQAEKAFSPRTKALILVHLFGGPADSVAFADLCAVHNVALIEDCAQAIGTKFQGRSVGTFGAIGCYSFFPSKNLGGFGDGGLVTTEDSGLAETLKSIRVHGQSGRYLHHRLGINGRLDALQAAVLRVKLSHLPEYNDARRTNAAAYRESFADLPVLAPPEPKDGYHTYNQFTIRTEKRDALAAFLTEKGIGTQIYYPVPFHKQPAFSTLGYKAGDFPVTEQCASEALSLPIFPELGRERLAQVIAAVEEFFRP